MVRRLVVHLGQTPVGLFEQGEGGNQSFRYHPSWLDAEEGRSISLSLPLRPEPFDDRSTRAFFGGLLPDDDLRTRLGRYLGVSPRNEFALLYEVGRECAGALILLPEGEEQPQVPVEGLRYLEDAELARVLDELPHRPLFVGDELRLSLAGAQDKLAVRVDGGRIALPLGGHPSTHILKTPIRGYQDTVHNEFLSMRLARKVGLEVPAVELMEVGTRQVLVVERYDRVISEDGAVQRLHQEDACQALGLPPSLKYQSEGGPSLPRIFGLLTESASRPARDRLALLDWVAFNFVVGNADAHGKNVSFLHGRSSVSLAPFYDLMATVVYPALSRKMAMKIGTKYRFDQVERRHWEAMARDAGLSAPQVVRRVLELAGTMVPAVREVVEQEELSEVAVIREVIAGIESRAAQLEKTLGG